MSPHDRMLEIALDELFGHTPPPELTGLILDAVRRRTRARQQRVGALFAVAAAAFLAAVLILRSSPAPEPAPGPSESILAQWDTWVATIAQRPRTFDARRSDLVQRTLEVDRAQRALARSVSATPGGIEYVAAVLGEPDLPAPQADAWLHALATLPSDAAHTLLRTNAPRRAALLSVETLLAIDAALPELIDVELDRRLRDEPDSLDAVAVAAQRVLRGDRRGVTLARRFVFEIRRDLEAPALYLACAAGLRRCGDPQAWGMGMDFALRAASERFSQSDLAGARRYVLMVERFDAMARNIQPVSLATRWGALAEAANQAEARLATPGAIMTRLNEFVR